MPKPKSATRRANKPTVRRPRTTRTQAAQDAVDAVLDGALRQAFSSALDAAVIAYPTIGGVAFLRLFHSRLTLRVDGLVVRS